MCDCGALQVSARLAALLEERANRGENAHIQAGFAYATIGDREKTIDALRRSFEAREPGLRNQARSPTLTALRGDPRYEELRVRIARGFD